MSQPTKTQDHALNRLNKSDQDAAELIVVRHSRIQDFLSTREAATTRQIAEQIGVSAITVRRDLHVLEQQGAIDRFHGGARLAEHRPEAEENFAARQRRNAEDKSRIGACALELIRQHDSLVMNDGTTVMQVALAIRNAGIECSVTTNALNVALALSDSDRLSVNILGGLVRRVSYGTYSPADESLAGMNFDLAILGAESLNMEEGVHLDYEFDTVTARRMMAHSARVAVVADSTKWFRRGRRLLATWEEVDILVTSSCPGEALSALVSQGVEVLIAPESS